MSLIPDKTGGPAYPHHETRFSMDDGGCTVYVSEPGLTIRQYYKAAALTGILVNIDEELRRQCVQVDNGTQNKMISLAAGQIADAMLAEDAEHAKKGGI